MRNLSPKGERDRADMARAHRAATDGRLIWHGARPRCAPAGTLYHAGTGRTVGHPVYVLDEANFERAEQAIALCMAHGLLAPATA